MGNSQNLVIVGYFSFMSCRKGNDLFMRSDVFFDNVNKKTSGAGNEGRREKGGHTVPPPYLHR